MMRQDEEENGIVNPGRSLAELLDHLQSEKRWAHFHEEGIDDAVP